MEAKDLRIGNLINHKIEGITEVDVISYSGNEDDRVNDFALKFYEGIPLSEEWLVKLGFQNIDDEIDFSEWQNEWVLIYGNGSDKQEPFRFNYSLNEKGEDIFIELLFVHQLQNLFYCLCGQELTLIK